MSWLFFYFSSFVLFCLPWKVVPKPPPLSCHIFGNIGLLAPSQSLRTSASSPEEAIKHRNLHSIVDLPSRIGCGEIQHGSTRNGGRSFLSRFFHQGSWRLGKDKSRRHPNLWLSRTGYWQAVYSLPNFWSSSRLVIHL